MILWAAVGTLAPAQATAEPPAPADGVAEIVAARLNLRSEADLDGDLLAILNKGDRVDVLMQLDGWLMVDSDGLVGYIRDRDKYVKIHGPSADAAAEGSNSPEAINRKIDRSQAVVDQMARKEDELLDVLNRMDRMLNAARIRSSRLKRELDNLNRDIAASEKEIERLKQGIHKAEVKAAKRVQALYKIYRMGKLNMLASASNVNDLFRRKVAIEMILEADQRQWIRLASAKSRLQDDLTIQRTRQQEVAQLESTLASQMETVSRQLDQRSHMLDQIKEKKSLAAAAVAALKKASLELDETIGSLNAEATVAPPIPQPAGELFSDRKGLLPMPVNGKVVAPFGPYLNPEFKILNFRSGVEIKADRGEPVHAVDGGKLLFASWFKGYGNMMIIDHGDSYYTVYAHVEEMFKHKGQTVVKGEVIATVGDTGSQSGARLYFEVRHHGKPQDPLDWMKTG